MRFNSAILLITVFTSIGACAVTPNGTRLGSAPKVSAPILALEDNSECSCPSSKAIVAKNSAANRQEIALNMLLEQPVQNRSCSYTSSVSIPAKDSKFIGCTIGEATSEILEKCPQFKAENGTCNTKQIPRKLALGNDRPPVSCLSACAVGSFNPELCTKISSHISRPEYRDRVNSIQALFQMNQTRIGKASYMALFDDDDDGGCNRADILLGTRNAENETPFENSGNVSSNNLECRVDAVSPALGAISIVIPEFLGGLFTPAMDGTTGFKMAFIGEQSKPEIRFKNQNMNDAYGGPVREIYWTPNRIIVESGRSCLAADL